MNPAILPLVVLVSTGCSAVLVRPAPSRIRDPLAPVECTPNETAAVLDLGTGLLGGVVTALAAPSLLLDHPEDRGKSAATLAVMAGASLVFMGAGLHGHRQSERCVEVKRVQARCIGGAAEACRELTPDWKPPAGYGGIQPAPGL